MRCWRDFAITVDPIVDIPHNCKSGYPSGWIDITIESGMQVCEKVRAYTQKTQMHHNIEKGKSSEKNYVSGLRKPRSSHELQLKLRKNGIEIEEK